MKTVYLVFDGVYSDRSLTYGFASREEAQRFIVERARHGRHEAAFRDYDWRIVNEDAWEAWQRIVDPGAWNTVGEIEECDIEVSADKAIEAWTK